MTDATGEKFKTQSKWAMHHFTETADEDRYACKICSEGGVAPAKNSIKANVSRGCTGLVSHLMSVHGATHPVPDELTGKRGNKRETRIEVAPTERVNVAAWADTVTTGSVMDVASQISTSTQSVSVTSNKVTVGFYASDQQLLYFIARNALAYTMADDPFCKQGHPHRHRKWCSSQMVLEGNELLKQLAKKCNTSYVSLTLDLGTTEGVRTTDLVLHAYGVSYPIEVLETGKKEGRVVRLLPRVVEIINTIQGLGCVVVAITTDNAANVKLLGTELAKKFPGIVPILCGCHSLQLFITQKVLPLKAVVDAREICDRVRPEWKKSEETDKKVPVEVETRWAFAVNVMKWVVHNKAEGLQNTSLSANDVRILEEAITLLTPFERASKILEDDAASPITSAQCIRSILPSVERLGLLDEFINRFQEHFMDDVFVLGAFFSATFDTAEIKKDSALVRLFQNRIRMMCVKFGVECDPVKMLREVNMLLEGILQVQFTASYEKEIGTGTIDAVGMFWETFSGPTHLPLLGSLFKRIRAMTVAEASAERMFSLQGLVHTDLRNRLSTNSIEASIRVAALQHLNFEVSFKRRNDPFPREVAGKAFPLEMLPVPQFLQFVHRMAMIEQWVTIQHRPAGVKVRVWFDDSGPCLATIYEPHDHKAARGHNLWLYCFDAVPEASDHAAKRRKKPAAVADEMVAKIVFNPTGVSEDIKEGSLTIPGRNDWDIVWGEWMADDLYV